MKPAFTATLFGASMALSTVCLTFSSTSCACFLNMCPEGENLDESCCAAHTGWTYYACQVELEGPYSTDWAVASVGQCFAGADEARAQAPGIAQLNNPGKVAASTSCDAVSCPGGGVLEVAATPLPSTCLLKKDGGLGFGGGAP